MRNILIFLMVTVALSQSCIRNIDSFPDSAIIHPSVSLPVGSGIFSTENQLFPVGKPEINLDQDVPSWGRYKVISIRDSITFSISELFDNVDSVRLIAFKMNVWNQFPAEAKLQVYFCDNKGNKMDSLWHDIPMNIDPGTFDLSWNPVKEAYSGSYAEMTGTRLETLRRIEYCSFVSYVYLEGIPVEVIRRFDEYMLKCQLAARIDFDYLID